MSYTDFPPTDFRFWLSRQAQQGSHGHSQALPSQFSMPQYPPPASSQPASYPAAPQGQMPSANFSTDITGSCPPGPFPNPDHYGSRADRIRRRHSRELTPYMRYMSPSPPRSFSPYLSSPSSSVTVTPILRHRRLNTPESGRSPRRFHGIGGFTPLRSRDVPRPTIESSVSTVRTCSQCGGTGAESSYEPFTDGSVAPTPQMGREDAVVGRGRSPCGEVEGQDGQEGPAEGHRRFQASVEDLDE
ncbi:hypothetical protein SLS63_011224 [Diaporthe eres]|uniref:Uncharacterized protein n=1 Tax=Diaporthe eres TaxID=83184 RepID=A0ABR1NUQ0_DIAER